LVANLIDQSIDNDQRARAGDSEKSKIE